MQQHGNKRNRQPPEDPEPDIDVSPEIIAERLARGREKLFDLFRYGSRHHLVIGEGGD